MIDEKQFTYPITIDTTMVNDKEQLVPSAYQKIVTEVVEKHLANINLDVARLIRDFGISWIMLSITLEIKRPVKFDDVLHGKTWFVYRKSVIFRREVAIYDQNDELVIACTTFTSLFNINERKMCSASIIQNDLNQKSGEELLTAKYRFRDSLEDSKITEVRKVRPSMIDPLGHVNNNRYGEFIYDALPASIRGKIGDLKRLEIYFQNELKPDSQFEMHQMEKNDEIIVFANRCEDGSTAFVSRLDFNQGTSTVCEEKETKIKETERL